MIRDLLNQKKKRVKFHTLGGEGIWTNLGHFHIFFLLFLIHANMQRKVYFVGVGAPPPLNVEILDISLFCYPNYVGL